jgi:RimJ/RimL family protein N-acetyltransferase
MLSLAHPLTTERLVLRPYQPDDLDALGEMLSDPDVVRLLYYGVREGNELRTTLEAKIRARELREEGDVLSLAAVLREDGELVADMTLIWRSREHRQGEIGYVVHPRHAGRGYATEAARELLRLGFEELGLHRICGRLDARNERSAKLLERLGMRREGRLVENERVKGEWTDDVIYALLDREWRGQVPRTP